MTDSVAQPAPIEETPAPVAVNDNKEAQPAPVVLAEPAETAPAAHTITELGDTTLPDIELGKDPRADMEALILRAAFREKAQTPEAFAELITRMKARFTALRDAITIDPSVEHTAMHIFAHRFDDTYKTHVKDGDEHTMAMQDIQSVFIHRLIDLNATLKALDDKPTCDALAIRAATLAEEPKLDTSLSDEKLTLLMTSLTGDGKGGIDTPIHFKHNFLAQHKLHAGLMDGFAAGSDVAQKLEESMQAALPGDEGFKAVLADWLTYRGERARGVMEATRPDFTVAQGAVARWKQGLSEPKQTIDITPANSNVPKTESPTTEDPARVDIKAQAGTAPIPANVLAPAVTEARAIAKAIELDLGQAPAAVIGA